MSDNRLIRAIENAGIPTIGLAAMRFGIDTVSCDYLDDEFTGDIRFQRMARKTPTGWTTSYQYSSLRGLDHWRQALASPRHGLVVEDGGPEQLATVVEDHFTGTGLPHVPDADDIAGADPAVGLIPDDERVDAVRLVDAHASLPSAGLVTPDGRETALGADDRRSVSAEGTHLADVEALSAQRQEVEA